MKREERRWCPQVSLNVAVSEVDKAVLLAHAPGSRFAVVPNGVDTEGFTPGAPGSRGIVFVGGTTWFPNRDALDYFAGAILPELRQLGVDEPVSWVGRASESERREFDRKHGIRMTGYVEDIRPDVAEALCYVVPLRIGGGTRIKILDAWALGKAVVSTSIGCEGLDARDGENILVRDDPRSFAEGIHRVLTDGAFRRRLEEGGRRTAEERYSWESLEPAMRSKYLSLVGSR
jgi:glycosyltransferase involved in cell wall biosynthesis